MKKKHAVIYQTKKKIGRPRSNRLGYKKESGRMGNNRFFDNLRATVIMLPRLTLQQALEIMSNGDCAD